MSKTKTKVIYACTECGAQSPKWIGQCNDCGAWNSLTEEVLTATNARSNRLGYAGAANAEVQLLTDVTFTDQFRMSSNISELDRVLGGGLVAGSVVLIGGDPGIGKSTLLLQTLVYLAQQNTTLYVTGEESLQQVAMRSRRLGLPEDKPLPLLAETNVERIIAIAEQQRPQIMVIDSIQTMYTETVPSAPGGVSQVRESAAQLVRFAKRTQTALLLVGHVTKEGSLAGPRVLEHMVDTVLYFEGESDGRFRLLRAMKNRFGAVNELGVFAMTEQGLREVTNPSAIFLSRYVTPVSGSVVMVTWEGSRPLLVEVQALADDSPLANPRRVTLGLEQNRLAMLLAVLHRHGGVATYQKDVFVNVVGGVRVTETAADLAVLLAVVSSLKNQPLPTDLMVLGEIGLAGEIRPVSNGLERLREAAKHGFKKAIVPHANAPKKPVPNLTVIPVQRLSDALNELRNA